MRFIAHRGNIEGPSNLENSPSQIDWCLEQFVDCEVDLWIQNGNYMLGHDEGQYSITKDWLLDRRKTLWIHCKNTDALHTMRNLSEPDLNFFWHQDDEYALTSQNYIWVYPGKLAPAGSISVLPESWLSESRFDEIARSFAICTDYVTIYKGKFEGIEY